MIISPMFSSENVIISGLTFTSLIPFDLILVYGVMFSSKFILGKRPCGCPIIPVPFVEKSISSPLSCLAPLSATSYPYMCSLFLDSLFCSLYLSIFMLIPHCVDYHHLINNLEIVSKFVLLFQICFISSWFFALAYEF